jgi:hypothetical protein
MDNMSIDSKIEGNNSTPVVETEGAEKNLQIQDSIAGNEEASASVAGENTPLSDMAEFVPWVDYIPKTKYVVPETLPERLRDSIRDLQEILIEKEKLKLAFVDKKIHKSYFSLWVRESNLIFSNIVKLKRRLKKLPPPKT